jgi:phosphatidylglycerophosphate synthase
MDLLEKDFFPRLSKRAWYEAWVRAVTSFCLKIGLSWVVICVFSMLFAIVSMASFMVAGDQADALGAILAWGAAFFCIQMSLICYKIANVLVEVGKGSPAGVIYNEFTDRLADVLILVGAGYSGAGEPGVVKLYDMLPLGWCAASVALGSEYSRLLGASLTGFHDFRGPMAKPQRMAVLSVGSCIELVQHLSHLERWGIKLALTLIFLGGLVTCWRRLHGFRTHFYEKRLK